MYVLHVPSSFLRLPVYLCMLAPRNRPVSQGGECYGSTPGPPEAVCPCDKGESQRPCHKRLVSMPQGVITASMPQGVITAAAQSGQITDVDQRCKSIICKFLVSSDASIICYCNLKSIICLGKTREVTFLAAPRVCTVPFSPSCGPIPPWLTG